MKRVILAVTNDLVIDQRLHRIALSLMRQGAHVLLVGRKRFFSAVLLARAYRCYRMLLLFGKGPLFYAEYNIRLFFFLLFHPFDMLAANDLDSLPACFFAAKLRRKTLLYDSHEFFTEVPELVKRPFVRKCWLFWEKMLVPRLKYLYTVSDSVASAYHKRYGVHMEVVRNMPLRQVMRVGEAHIPLPERFIVYQGALNEGRGLEALIEAMDNLPEIHLIFVGDGPLSGKLRHLATKRKACSRILFTGKTDFALLPPITSKALLGLTLEENSCLNYRYSLPNKLFDYIQAGIPVLATTMPETEKILKEYDIGLLIDCPSEQAITTAISNMLSDKTRYLQWKKNLQSAAEKLCWEKEEYKLIRIYKNAGL